MTRLVVVEDVSLTAKYILETIDTTQYEIVVLYDANRDPDKQSGLSYQAMDYLDLSYWQKYIEKEDIVLMNALPEMFGDGLWHGKPQVLCQLIKDYVYAAEPIEVIEYDDVIAYKKMKTKQAASFQQIPVPQDYTVQQGVIAYAHYLKKMSLGLIQVKGQPERFDIHLLNINRPLIEMKQINLTEGIKLTLQSNSLLYQSKNNASSFYFIHNGQALYTCLAHFTPRLPWRIYKYTQAVIHEWVMRGFRSYLRGLNQGNEK